MMNTTRWSLLLTLLIATGCGDCGDDTTDDKNNDKPDLANDMSPDLDPDLPDDIDQGDMGDEPDQGDMGDMGADTTAPTVSITSGMMVAADGSYQLTGSFMDDRGVVSLSYTVNDSGDIVIEPSSSPFSVDVPLAADALITVTATDAAGNEGQASVMVKINPGFGLVPDFTVSPLPSTFLPTAFDASATMDSAGRTLTYAWDFGDSSTGSGVQVGHLYREPGTYNVKLTVSTADGAMEIAEREVIVADPPATGMATLRGSVTDAAGAPVGGVDVFNRLGAKLATTDGEGRFAIMAGTDTPLVYVLRRSDYTTQVLRTEIPAGTQEASASVAMTPRSLPVFLLDAAAGGAVVGPRGARIEFPAGGLVDDETGMPVSGPVAVTITPLDHAAGQSRAFPGLFAATGADGNLDRLISYGLMEVTLTQNGRKVQLAQGKPATVEIPYTVAQGQAGDMLPFWSLDERTGLWILEQAMAPIQAASEGGGLVQRATISHFSWINIDQLAAPFGGPRFDVPIEFVHNNTPIIEASEVDLNLDDCFAPGRVRFNKTAVRSGDTIDDLFSGCNVGVSARSTTGRYFGDVVVNPMDAQTPIRVEMIDAETLTVLAPNTPVTNSLMGATKRYYAFDAAAGGLYGLRLRSASGATLNGVASLRSPNRLPRPPQSFNAARDTIVYAAAPVAGLWVVEVSAASGAGDFTIELLPNAGALLNDDPSQSFQLASGARRDLLVRASQADLARIVASGSPALDISILDSREQPVFNALASASDTGLVRFPAGGVFIARITNNGGATDVNVDYAPSEPPIVLTPNPRFSLQRPLSPGQVQAFILPHYGEAGLVARVKNAMGGDAPQLSVYSSAQTPFPSPALNERELRRPDGDESIAAMRLPMAGDAARNAAFVYVSRPGAQPAGDYALDLDLVRKADTIKAGTCQGAQTPSLFAASIALADAGELTACPEDHETFAGLRFSQPSFTLRGEDRALSKLTPWPGVASAISTGVYGENAVLITASATIEDITIINRAAGIALSAGDATAISIERTNIEAAQPLVSQGLAPTTCLTAQAQSNSMASVLFADSSCTNTQEGINVSSFDDVTIRQSSFATSSRGVIVNGAKTSAINQNTFTGAVQAITSAQQSGAATIQGNVITQSAGVGNTLGGTNISLTTLPINAQPQSLIQNNTINMAGSGSVGIAVGYNAAGGEITIDGNKIVGAGAATVGIRALASAANIVGGKIKIYNNILRALGLHAIHILQADALGGVDIFNNSMRTPDINTSSESMINIANRANNGTATVSIINNIFSGGSGNLLGANGVSYPNTIGLTRDYNLFFQVATPYLPSGLTAPPGANTNDRTGDPLFSDDDLKVNSNSPAINNGTATNAPTTSYGGGMRPIGGAHDIGAHER